MDIASILKLVGLLIATASAILGVLRETRDRESGRLTKTGRWTIAFATFGFLLAAVTLAAESHGTLRSAAEQLQRHERALLGYTQFRRLSVIGYLAPDTPPAALVAGDPLAVRVTFFRGGASELDVLASATPGAIGTLQQEARPRPVSPTGWVVLQGPVQFAKTDLLEMDTVFAATDPSGIRKEGPTFWLRLWRHEIAERLGRHHGFRYWPYDVLGDLQDVALKVSASGSRAGDVREIVLRFNEQWMVSVPADQFNKSSQIDDVFLALRKISR